MAFLCSPARIKKSHRMFMLIVATPEGLNSSHKFQEMLGKSTVLQTLPEGIIQIAPTIWSGLAKQCLPFLFSLKQDDDLGPVMFRVFVSDKEIVCCGKLPILTKSS